MIKGGIKDQAKGMKTNRRDDGEDSIEFGSDGEDVLADEMKKVETEQKILGKRNRTQVE